MIKLDGINLTGTAFTHVEINGAWITAKTLLDKQTISIRKPSDEDWYDEAHRAVTIAVAELEGALFRLLSEEQS